MAGIRFVAGNLHKLSPARIVTCKVMYDKHSPHAPCILLVILPVTFADCCSILPFCDCSRLAAAASVLGVQTRATRHRQLAASASLGREAACTEIDDNFTQISEYARFETPI